ncbi:hypothetical protein [Duganella sp. BuS-21]|uniref:hypothetical protein n=1 Tax=Duganella sp. BuS-21 TaxID=2943848 RepID=UPI0035A66AC6
MRAEACGAEEAGALLARFKSWKTDRLNRISLAQVVGSGQAYKIVTDAGEVVAAYVLAQMGVHLWIMAACGKAAFDLTAALSALIDVQAAGFQWIGFRTERRGLVRKVARHGYEVTREEGGAYYLRKNIEQ